MVSSITVAQQATGIVQSVSNTIGGMGVSPPARSGVIALVP